MKVKSIEEIRAVCERVAEQTGVEIYDVNFRQGKSPSLEITIDKEGGVDLDTCEIFHNAVEGPLDELDLTFGEPYTLNVSSKGIDWAFRTDEDFLSHIGKKVEVRLKTPLKGKKYYDGILEKYDKENIVVKVDGKTTLSIDLKKVEKVNEYIDFE